MEFDHIGIPAAERRDGMRFLESKRLWLTSPADHPYRVEWLWYEEDSPEAELVRKNLGDVATDEIERAEAALLAAGRSFFKVTDRQLNLEYVPPERREPLRKFCASLTMVRNSGSHRAVTS